MPAMPTPGSRIGLRTLARLGVGAALLAVPVTAMAAGPGAVAAKRPALPASGTWKVSAVPSQYYPITAAGTFTVTKKGQLGHLKATISPELNDGAETCPGMNITMAGNGASLPLILDSSAHQWVLGAGTGSVGGGHIQPAQIALHEVITDANSHTPPRTLGETLYITFAPSGKTTGTLSYDNGLCTLDFTATHG